jgi:hypothetical protein
MSTAVSEEHITEQETSVKAVISGMPLREETLHIATRLDIEDSNAWINGFKQ